MLVLSRKRDQSIIIADNIKVTVVDIRGDKVRLGIDAPQNVTVDREEVHHAKLSEQAQRVSRQQGEVDEKSICS